ncbi:hypothetical protein EI94DRAFT_1810592 [Lactarius quietus]|nr:hypothetical protein EI94DRAFT_1810592 [Lactarius quietus]
MIPRGIPGTWMWYRIDEYHRQNLGQIAAAQMLFSTANPESKAKDKAVVTEAKQFSLAKLIQFDPKEHQPGVLTLKKQTRPGKAPQETLRITEVHTDDSDSEDGPSQFTCEFPPHILQPVHRDSPSIVAEHPYGTAKSRTKQDDEPVLPLPPLQKSEHAYTTNSNIYNGAVAGKVYEHLLDTKVTAVIEDFVPPKLDHTVEAHMPAAFSKAMREPPADATIIVDPYEAFLRAQHSCQDHEDDPIEVVAESTSLRAILPVVDNQEKIEAILDPSCQIVAMSEEVCNALALPYDPNIRLNMVLENGGVDQSLD